jgi:hypothetical protein
MQHGATEKKREAGDGGASCESAGSYDKHHKTRFRFLLHGPVARHGLGEMPVSQDGAETVVRLLHRPSAASGL